MTLVEILEQVKSLNQHDRKELVKYVIDTLDEPAPKPPVDPNFHWGQNLLRLLDELEPIELIHPEIEDPVEWVKQIRREKREKRLGDWGEDE